MFKKIALGLLSLIVVLGVIFALGPREEIDETLRFSADAVGSDIEGYLAKSEAAFTDIKPGAEKRIIWDSDIAKVQTDIAVVNIHGFSASSEEIRPVPDMVADRLQANLFFGRLAGHARSPDAMAEPSVNDWMNDTAEAIEIGRRIGKKVIIISTSTGGTLATWAATKPDLIKDVAGIVFISPNYAVQNASADILTLPWARQLVPVLAGAERSWEPMNAEQEKWWSTTYPTVAALPMKASIDHVRALPFEDIKVPALFMFHDDDGVVKSSVTREVAARWGGPAKIIAVEDSTDTSKHVIAGAITSPENTQMAVDAIVEWAEAL
ncbi:carboxylesterase [Ahrensia sp. R2A130]|uniref:alpha/beta hydrolase n=1 Tax=Ahrensia sp. R2A130 TaxID=744979 RepID=UPI0001E09C03|nr:alpha/beta fold hydrolase [Ahrensia sp. R2A130]EFL90034.1 putative carboxylesterase [Ahrensia sp. R2A130]